MRARPAIAQGVRAGVVTVLPLLVGVAVGDPRAYTWAALGGFQASLADNGGPYRVRAAGMIAVVVGGAVAVLIGSVGGLWPDVAVPLAFAAAFASGMVRAFGSNGSNVGLLNLAIFLVALASPQSLPLAAVHAGYFLAGAALAAVLTLALWPFQPYQPARQAVAESYRRLRDLLVALAELPAAGDHGTDAWYARGRELCPPVRAALDDARAQITAVRAARDGEMRRGEQLVTLVLMGEHSLGICIGLPVLMEESGILGDRRRTDAVSARCRSLAADAEAVADGAGQAPTLGLGGASTRVPVEAASALADAAPSPGAAVDALAPLAGTELVPALTRLGHDLAFAREIASVIRSGSTIASLVRPVAGGVLADPVSGAVSGGALGGGSGGASGGAIGAVPPGAGGVRGGLASLVALLWTPLAENMTFRSLTFRHALRMAAGVSAAELLTSAIGLPRGYWMTLTTGFILQPYAGATVERGVQRVVGTVIGGLLAAALTLAMHGTVAVSIVVFALTVLAVAVRPLGYGYFVLFLTPLIVLIAEGFQSDPRLAAYRVLNTILGGALALACGVLLWPEYEGAIGGPLLGAAVAAARANVLAVLAPTPSSAEVNATRRTLALAIGNAEGAFQRAASEGRRRAVAVGSGLAIITILRRLMATSMAIATVHDDVAPAAPSALRATADLVLADLDGALRERRAPSPLPPMPLSADDGRSLQGRVLRQLEMLQASVARFVSLAPPAAVVVAALVLGAGCHRAAPSAPRARCGGDGRGYVVMLSLDGFGAEYPGGGATPNLDRIAAAGVRAASLVPVFPSKTFPNHYSIVTGLTVAHHGLAGNQFYDPSTRRLYRVSDTTAVRDASWYGGEPIWVTAERQGVRSAVFLWPGSEAPIGGLHPSRYKEWSHDRGVPPLARVDTALAWLGLPRCERPHLVLLYDELVDEAGHAHGASGAETRAAVRAADSLVGRLYDGLRALPVRDSVTLLVVSDHGMATVEHVGTTGVVVDPHDSSVVALTDGVVGAWWFTDSAARRRTTATLDTIAHAHLYGRGDLPARYHAAIPRIGDLVLVADVGWQFFPAAAGGAAHRVGGGTHGYDPAAPAMQAIFVAAGAGLRRGVVLPPLDNVAIYPLIADLLGLEPAATDGRLSSTAFARATAR
jgi:uncharacterized membrane protein YccC/predicted AlkP superfamily pyrophosphatase or phosphodiesterase